MGEAVHPEDIIVGKKGQRKQAHYRELLLAMEESNERRSQFCQWYQAHNQC
jgi:hypothetical protein